MQTLKKKKKEYYIFDCNVEGSWQDQVFYLPLNLPVRKKIFRTIKKLRKITSQENVLIAFMALKSKRGFVIMNFAYHDPNTDNTVVEQCESYYTEQYFTNVTPKVLDRAFIEELLVSDKNGAKNMPFFVREDMESQGLLENKKEENNG